MHNSGMNYERLYGAVLQQHFSENRQMALVSGPRQVGKTTVCQRLADHYLNWDNMDDRETILAGPAKVADFAGLARLKAGSGILTFDELHRFPRWKDFLKGFFDVYGAGCRIIVTGSSRLDVFSRGGDSLMGRYFLYRMHPLSVGELVRPSVRETSIFAPADLVEDDWRALWNFGGFPEPFSRREERFSNRWWGLRRNQLLQEDVRDLTRISALDQLAVLVELLEANPGQQLNFAALARTVRASENTTRAWVETLNSLHHGFIVRPWYRSVNAAIRKMPKWYPRDWSNIEDKGQRAETLVACHLLKAVEGWTDMGFGRYGLYYIRDKQQREVDFVVVRNGKPWFLVEVKHADTSLSPTLEYMQKQTGAEHAFQVVLDEDFVDRDCFSRRVPTIVPARTRLRQLV